MFEIMDAKEWVLCVYEGESPCLAKIEEISSMEQLPDGRIKLILRNSTLYYTKEKYSIEEFCFENNSINK